MPKPECFVNKKGTVQCTIVQTNYLLLELFLLPVMNCDRGFVSYSKNNKNKNRLWKHCYFV